MATSYDHPYNLFGGSSSDVRSDPAAATARPSHPNPDTSSNVSATSFAAAVGSRSRNRPPNVFRTRFFFNSAPTTTNQPNNPTVITAKNGITIEASLYEFTNKDFLTAIKAITGPAQIHSYSRLQGQFSVYFVHPSFASNLILHGLNMPGCLFVPCHPVGAPPVRVVVSDVPTHFEPSFLREIMSTYGRVVGPIKTLRASRIDEDLDHVLSFRRQVMMHFASPQARASLPDRVFITYNDYPLTFFNTTEIKCHHCGLPGHARGVCPDLSRSDVPPIPIAAVDPPPSEAVILTASQSTSAAAGPIDASPPAVVSSDLPLTDNTPHPEPLTVKPSSTGLPAATPPQSTAPQSAFTMPIFDMSPIIPRVTPEIAALCAQTVSASFPVPPPASVPASGQFKRPNPATVSSNSAAKKLQRPASSTASDSQSVGNSSDCSQDDVMDESSSTAVPSPPISDSYLVQLFAAFHRSTVPLLVHIRTQLSDSDIPRFLTYLRHIRKHPAVHEAGPLAHLSSGAIYQWERRVRRELSAATSSVA